VEINSVTSTPTSTSTLFPKALIVGVLYHPQVKFLCHAQGSHGVACKTEHYSGSGDQALHPMWEGEFYC
jgi:hypothetical protein